MFRNEEMHLQFPVPITPNCVERFDTIYNFHDRSLLFEVNGIAVLSTVAITGTRVALYFPAPLVRKRYQKRHKDGANERNTKNSGYFTLNIPIL